MITRTCSRITNIYHHRGEATQILLRENEVESGNFLTFKIYFSWYAVGTRAQNESLHPRINSECDIDTGDLDEL